MKKDLEDDLQEEYVMSDISDKNKQVENGGKEQLGQSNIRIVAYSAPIEEEIKDPWPVRKR